MYTIAFKPSAKLQFDTVMSDLTEFRAFLMQSDSERVSIDLSGVLQCDSAGLAFLIEAKRICQSYGKSLEIRETSDKLRSLAEFCGIQDLWSMV